MSLWKPGLNGSAMGWSYLFADSQTQNAFTAPVGGLFVNNPQIVGPTICMDTEYPVATNSEMFNSILLAVLEGCKTASGGDGGSMRTPAHALVKRGANCAVGFSRIIYPDRVVNGQNQPGAETWSRVFWQAVHDGWSVRDAIDEASNAVHLNSNMRKANTYVVRKNNSGSLVSQTIGSAPAAGNFTINDARYNVAPVQ